MNRFDGDFRPDTIVSLIRFKGDAGLLFEDRARDEMYARYRDVERRREVFGK